MDGKLKALVKM
jgi:ATP-binding cassette subfamily E protein 1